MTTAKLTTTGLFTALLCILGPLSITLPFSPVPFSLGTLGVLLACLLLKPKGSLLCVCLYLLLGLVGLPVFSGFTGGAGKILGPTGGYLLGYLFLAGVGSLLVNKWKSSMLLQALGLFIGMLCCYFFGTIWLILQTKLDISAALWTGFLPYIPFDIAKILASLALCKEIRKRL